MINDHPAVFSTPRLYVRPASVEDVEMFYTLWTDPRVMSNVGFPRGLRITRGEIEKKIRNQGDSEFDQFLVVVHGATVQKLGECKLHRPDSEGIATTDIKLLPEFWGNKYGVEIKRALLDYLFTNTGCGAVEASPNVSNSASIKMQEAVGGERLGEDIYHFPEKMRDFTTSVHHYIYRVTRKTWEMRSKIS